MVNVICLGIRVAVVGGVLGCVEKHIVFAHGGLKTTSVADSDQLSDQQSANVTRSGNRQLAGPRRKFSSIEMILNETIIIKLSFILVMALLFSLAISG